MEAFTSERGWNAYEVVLSISNLLINGTLGHR